MYPEHRVQVKWVGNFNECCRCSSDGPSPSIKEKGAVIGARVNLGKVGAEGPSFRVGEALDRGLGRSWMREWVRLEE